jgi:hypothetical protein
MPPKRSPRAADLRRRIKQFIRIMWVVQRF